MASDDAGRGRDKGCVAGERRLQLAGLGAADLIQVVNTVASGMIGYPVQLGALLGRCRYDQFACFFIRHAALAVIAVKQVFASYTYLPLEATRKRVGSEKSGSVR